MITLDIPAYATGSCGVTHVDEGMLKFFATHGCRSLLDVGCGPGGQVQLARSMGWRALGIDVDITLYRRPGVALCDLCVEPVLLPEPADLVWSVETAEHIPPECVDRYIETLARNAKVAICMTASQVPMDLHVSVHPVAWWVERVTASGEFTWDRGTLNVVAQHSTMARSFLSDTGMVFWRAS
jgi:hypothetical protein